MSDATISRPSDWDSIATLQHTYARIVPVTACAKCGGLRKDLGGPHSPRFVGGVQVDCAGVAL